MSKTDGFSEYSCDVLTCTRHDFAQPDTDKADSYSVRKRYTDDGVLREIMLCAEHNETYSKLVGECEKSYIAFEHDGSYTLATQEEVAALQEQVSSLEAQVEQLQTDYEAMKKDRNSWMKKYNELNEEFEEYKRTHPDTDGGGE